jgi:hypothetical protein
VARGRSQSTERTGGTLIVVRVNKHEGLSGLPVVPAGEEIIPSVGLASEAPASFGCSNCDSQMVPLINFGRVSLCLSCLAIYDRWRA